MWVAVFHAYDIGGHQPLPQGEAWLTLTPHRGISQDKLPLYLGFFAFVHNARRRGKALLGALVAALVA